MMEACELVTIIIPVYNTEQFLTECLNSAVSQTYHSIEIIVVNDGSTDESEKIINLFLSNYSNIKYIKKENGGLSSARNAGLEEAKGKYVVFLDSDDRIESTFVYEMVSKIIANKLDFISCDVNLNGLSETYKEDVMIFNQGESIFRYLKGDLSVPESCCTKMYKTILFNDIRFPLNKIHEDTFTTYKIIEKSTSIGYYRYNGYIVNERLGSITRSSFTEKNFDKVEACYELMNHYRGTVFGQIAFDKFLGSLLYYILKTNKRNVANEIAYKVLDETLKEYKYKIRIKFLPFVFLHRLKLLPKIYVK